jgi:homospermidine synthase
MIKNPKKGFCLPDDINHEEILETSIPYIKPFVSLPVDWTPLKNMNTTFTKFDVPKPQEEDVWQFTTFLVDPRERLRINAATEFQPETADI